MRDNKIFSYFKTIASAGSGNIEDNRIRRKVILANEISISLFILGLPILFLFIFVVKQALLVFMTITVLAFTLIVPYINRRGHHTASRVAICLVATFTAGLAPVLTKMVYPESISLNMYYGPRIFLLSMLTLPLLLIDLREKPILIFCLIINAFYLFAFDIIDQLCGVGFHQMGFDTIMYYNINLYVLVNFLFILSALLYLQYHNHSFEEEVIHLNKTLDAKVNQKTKQLEEVNNDLEAFNYTVSHELKTPLTAAQMLSRNLIQQYGTKLGDTGQQHLVTIDNCMTEMQGLIKNIMTFSRLGDEEIKNETLDINQIVQEVIDEQSKLMDVPVNLKINKEPLANARGDRAMIKLAFSNLFSNAIKYSRHQEHPELKISSISEELSVTYVIKDNGIGFDQNQDKKLFELFERLHSKSKYEGSGVGLAIVKRIIDKHGGKIWANGQPAEGATFYFSLQKAESDSIANGTAKYGHQKQDLSASYSL